MHVPFWMQAVSPEFGTAGDKQLLTLDFLPPHERHSGPVSQQSKLREPVQAGAAFWRHLFAEGFARLSALLGVEAYCPAVVGPKR